MELYELMYEATGEAEGYREVAQAAERVAVEHAKAFADWCLHTDDLKNYGTDQAYENWRKALGYE